LDEKAFEATSALKVNYRAWMSDESKPFDLGVAAAAHIQYLRSQLSDKLVSLSTFARRRGTIVAHIGAFTIGNALSACSAGRRCAAAAAAAAQFATSL